MEEEREAVIARPTVRAPIGTRRTVFAVVVWAVAVLLYVCIFDRHMLYLLSCREEAQIQVVTVATLPLLALAVRWGYRKLG